jgi:hypothetical protein
MAACLMTVAKYSATHVEEGAIGGGNGCWLNTK